MASVNNRPIGYILKWFPRQSQTFVLNEILELQRQGINPIIIARKGSPIDPSMMPATLQQLSLFYLTPRDDTETRWRIMPASRAARDLVDTHHQWEHDSESSFAIDSQAAVVASLVQRLGIGHLHAHFASWATALAARVSVLSGVSYSFTAHARDIYHRRVVPADLVDKMSMARFVVTVSDYNQRYLTALLPVAEQPGRVRRLYNGVDLTRLPVATTERVPDLIVGVGRLVAKKGFRHLVHACHRLLAEGRSLRCLLVGEGAERVALEQQIADSGLTAHVQLVGSQPHDAVLRLMTQATMMVLPCVVDAEGDRDGLPTVLVEAMALATPVISTRLVGIPELITDGQTGLLTDPGDADGLAQAMARLLDDAPWRMTLGEAGRRVVTRDFDLRRNVATLASLLRASLADARPMTDTHAGDPADILRPTRAGGR